MAHKILLVDDEVNVLQGYIPEPAIGLPFVRNGCHSRAHVP